MRQSYRAPRRARHALRDWPTIRGLFQDLDELLLLVDYDGTLAPIAPTPEEAYLPAKTRIVLRRIRRLRGVTVGIVSGRSLQTVKKLARIPGLVYVGNHGCEIRGPGLNFVHPAARRSRPHMKHIATDLRQKLAEIPGSRVESKGLSISVHWRGVSARKVAECRRLILRVLSPWRRRGKIRVTHGKRVVEVRAPVMWHKGSSVEWINRHLDSARSRGICYLGDDRTDEDAFRAVNRLHGISISIGAQRQATTAKWWLADCNQVREYLARLYRMRLALSTHRE